MNKEMINTFSGAYEEYKEAIGRYIYYRVSNREIAEDILQETFLKTWNYMAVEEKEVRDIKNFLYMVASNLVIDYYRQKDKTPISIENVHTKDILTQPRQQYEVDRRIGLSIFKKYLVRLEANYRRVIAYRYLDHLSIDEICERTGKSPNYVSVLIYQGVKSIKEKIDKAKPPTDPFNSSGDTALEA